MTTTTTTIHDSQIEELAGESAAAGDMMMYWICQRALGRRVTLARMRDTLVRVDADTVMLYTRSSARTHIARCLADRDAPR